MLDKTNMRVMFFAAAVAALSGCGKTPDAVAPATAPAATTQAFDFTPVVVPSKPQEWVDISTDEPKDFETPLGKGFKIKKSGLAWKVLDEGFPSGGGVQPGQKVEVRYTVYHEDMKEIESNEDPKTSPYMFVLGAKSKEILPFWHEAALGMHRNAKKRLIVPATLAWGKEGYRTVKPDETVIIDFKIERFWDKSREQIRQEELAKVQPDTQPGTLPTDLIVEDVKEGTGEYLKHGMRGTFKYVGKLADGKEFDHGDSFAFRLGTGNVIQGWELGVKNMRVGGVRKLTIPARLGYGASGQGPIPGNATLYFELELLRVDP